MTIKAELKKLLADGWIITDPSCNQLMKEIIEDNVYLFREDRIVNPETNETKSFESEMIYDDLNKYEIIDACLAFGYKEEEVSKWIEENENISLMLECVFELEY